MDLVPDDLDHAALERRAEALGFHVPMPDGHEEQLIERLRRRDEAAFNELVRLYQERVFRLVLRMLGDRSEAEDVAQEVFITVFKSIEGFRGDSKLSTWLYRVATNHCKNRIKYLDRRARGKKKELDEIAEHGAVESASMSSSAQVARPDQQAEANQIETIVREAIMELDEDQRVLVIMRDVENMSYEEIQQETGLPEGTVKSRLHRARLALAKAVQRATGERRSSTPAVKASSGKK
ncbi:sigma-70 family RNA polymerase sigma factor [Sandaracinus amylolyticus]|uniref:RNA polymerase sigma factor n=1 Tax=Sandaracinus amylolyticus TaxID=927083 RepID=A0A0F6SI02_9BACT|nr:sigma-70 family RNA polymerase sigma factor [Sandaracinus amylolyticus]AKF11339.1 RNA polymerase sigma factor RpoE [Sandaracinus amylolyticus]